jgi:hypothetical protein
VRVREAAPDLGQQSSAPFALRNWVVNGIISLPYLFLAAPTVLILGASTLNSLGLTEVEGLGAGFRDWVALLVTALVFSAPFAFLAWRALTRGVVASPAGLRVRKVFYTRDIAWCDIDRVRLRTDAQEDRMTWHSPVVEGPCCDTELDLPIASSSERKAQRYIERLNATLARQKADGGGCP